MYYINYFFIFSIIGHILESIFFDKSGILFGWWTPVYGLGFVLIICIHNFIDKLKLNTFLKKIYLFIFSAIILSIIEGLGGYLIEIIFHTTFWDYTKYKFNIGKYVSLEMSLIWGICSLIAIYVIKPLFDKIISKIPKYLTYILIILFILDCFLTLIIKH